MAATGLAGLKRCFPPRRSIRRTLPRRRRQIIDSSDRPRRAFLSCAHLFQTRTIPFRGRRAEPLPTPPLRRVLWVLLAGTDQPPSPYKCHSREVVLCASATTFVDWA